MSTPAIQWYPGHIAKAERSLQAQLKRVDVVLEVRDSRIPLSTLHPKLDEWLEGKKRVLVMNRVDMIVPEARDRWQQWFREQGQVAYYTDANQGKGVGQIARAAQAAGTAMNQRRKERGMRSRPVRAVVVGFPNVGKSALINRLLKRKVVESARKAGVTRQLRWVRISDELELLDAPGIIPAQLDDQVAALKLAICDDIGKAAYDTQRVAAAFVDLLKDLDIVEQSQTHTELPVRTQALLERYEIDPTNGTGETYLQQLADAKFQGSQERAAQKILTEFRKGVLGKLMLELPPAAAPIANS
ncbi:MAG: ribosome biogenesis GTPase YlqF [Leptolyngbya foveolarum]|uniref:Ribosome biogenesis GTPase A n=1 Tax=Leptolyngbya foveolarum TaxID=47253 RepID=A0A2W4UDG2_9CYAN|nr:MAG: ribosome biogenesis GTPase YlqF [Leptolyngbya foveolarum]